MKQWLSTKEYCLELFIADTQIISKHKHLIKLVVDNYFLDQDIDPEIPFIVSFKGLVTEEAFEQLKQEFVSILLTNFKV